MVRKASRRKCVRGECGSCRVVRAPIATLADCKSARREKCSFSKHGGIQLTIGRRSAPFFEEKQRTPRPVRGHDVAMRREEQREERGRWTCSTARAWRRERACLTAKYLDMDPRGITQNFQTTIAFQQVLRRAHDARPDSAAGARLPRDDLARYVRVPHPARPHARARGAARSTGHWSRVCSKS